MLIDTAFGGLTPTEKGGGRQTKNLRLRDPRGKEWVLRSVDKTLGKALPEEARGTFIETIVDDQVSTGHPFAAITVPMMAKAAGIYHTNPRIVYIPRSPKLGEFNDEFGNQLFLLEERPDDDQSDVATFGNSKEVVSTDKMLEKVAEKNDHRVDQEFYIRSRLFDMFLSDWGRHEDQWRWATFEADNEKIYKPIPRDRDQTYTLFDGFIVKPLSGVAQKGVESFSSTIKNVPTYNFPARYLDHRFTNEQTKATWVTIAKDLQQRLTDAVIDSAVKQMPPEMFSISGPTIIEKLKSRRDHLAEYAERYYNFLASEVDVVGSKERERFELKFQENGDVQVQVYRIADANEKGNLLYSRNFSRDETYEIRVYGIGGVDQYVIEGKNEKKIRVRIVGGPDTDEFKQSGDVRRLYVYDDQDNQFEGINKTRLPFNKDSTIHLYDYKGFRYGGKGMKMGIGYNNRDRIFLRTGYYIEKMKWRKNPYGFRHDLNINYSLMQNAFSVEYRGVIVEAIGKWNLNLTTQYDRVLDFQFFGVGNDTRNDIEDNRYYRTRTREIVTGIGISRSLSKYSTLGFHGFYEGFRTWRDEDKFVATYPFDDKLFGSSNYAGIRSDFAFLKLDDNVTPTKGIGFSTELSYTHPFQETTSAFGRGVGTFGFYIPLLRNFSFASKSSGAMMTDSSEYYQMNKIGGASTFRGFPRFRLMGQHFFYSNNELQWIVPFKSYIMNGKIGLVGLFDIGRVWIPYEKSTTWHSAYGGGVLLAPFNKAVLVGTFAKGDDGWRLNVRYGRLF